MTQGRRGQRQSRVHIHTGKALVRFAELYPGLMRTLMEMIQNGIDAGAKHIFIGIDQQRKMVAVADTGRGFSMEDMDRALANVANEEQEAGKIGRFRIGMFSPLTECDNYTIASWKRERGSTPNIWYFSRKELVRQEDSDISSDPLDTMPAIEEPFTKQARVFAQNYRTVVTLHGVSDDKVASQVDLDELEYLVQSQLGTHLHQKGVSCRIVLRNEKGKIEELELKPYEFKGEYLGRFEDENDLVGKVVLDLYRARFSGRRRSILSVSEGPPKTLYGVPWANVSQHGKKLERGYWADSSPIFKVFDGGYFEGMILGEKLELNDGRDGFKGGDALKGLIMALDTWFHEHGQRFYSEERDKKITERQAEITGRALRTFQDRILRNPALSFVTDEIPHRISIGSIGRGHGEPTDPIGKEPVGSTRTKSTGEGKRAGQPSKSGEGPGRDKDLPVGVVGRGRRRTKVKDDSVGLWIEIVDLENPYQLWEFEIETGRITFNSGHPLWGELDGSFARQRTSKHDDQIERLQVWVMSKIVLFLKYADDPVKFQVLNEDAHVEALVMAEVLFKQ